MLLLLAEPPCELQSDKDDEDDDEDDDDDQDDEGRDTVPDCARSAELGVVELEELALRNPASASTTDTVLIALPLLLLPRLFPSLLRRVVRLVVRLSPRMRPFVRPCVRLSPWSRSSVCPLFVRLFALPVVRLSP